MSADKYPCILSRQMGAIVYAITDSKHRHAMHARVIFFGWVDYLKHCKRCLHFYKRKKSINAEKNESVELTHTQVFCGRLCVLCE